jgi:hypothetical protein
MVGEPGYAKRCASRYTKVAGGWFFDRRCAVVVGSLIGGVPWWLVLLIGAAPWWWLVLRGLLLSCVKFVPVFLLRRRLRLWWLLSGGLHWMCEV